MTETLEVCGGCARSKSKTHALREKKYTQGKHPGESISVNTNGTFPDILIVNCYWIGVIGDYNHYYWGIFTKVKSQMPKKMAEIFEKMMSHGTPVIYI